MMTEQEESFMYELVHQEYEQAQHKAGIPKNRKVECWIEFFTQLAPHMSDKVLEFIYTQGKQIYSRRFREVAYREMCSRIFEREVLNG